MSEKISGEMYRHIRLCIDSYEHGVPVGRYYHPSLGEDGCVFLSLTQLLVGVEELLDSIQFPQSFTAKHSFSRAAEPRMGGGAAAEKTQQGALATFQIRMLFRQHTSWQGSVTWVEGGSEETFRSVLELILLIDSALGGCNA